MKTKSTFTPGPWEISGGDIWATTPWNARFRLATITKPSPMNGVDWQANARLIAAAPAMLAVLQEIVDAGYLDDGYEPTRQRALIAIELATVA